MKTILGTIGIVLAITLLSGCTTEKSDGVYYEIVLEKADCDPLCKEEYILLSNGTMMKKYTPEKGIFKDEIEIVKIDESTAKEAIEMVQNLPITESKSRCEFCDEYTLFMIKEGAAFMFVDTEDNTPNEIKEIFDSSTELFKTGEKEEDFFIQFVYKRLGQNSIDFHFFPNGAVLYEEFDEQLNLTKARVYDISEERIEFLKNSVKPEFFEAQSSILNCYRVGLANGYIEIKKGNSYNFVWTCGVEDSSADELFNALLKEFG